MDKVEVTVCAYLYYFSLNGILSSRRIDETNFVIFDFYDHITTGVVEKFTNDICVPDIIVSFMLKSIVFFN